MPGSPDPAPGSWNGRNDNSCPPLHPKDGHRGAGEVPWTIQGARGWGGDAPSPPLPHFQCCLDLCLGRGSEGALAAALRRLRAMRLIPDLVYFCKTSTSSRPPSPAPHLRRLLMGGTSKLKTVFLSPPPSCCKRHFVRGGARGSPPPACFWLEHLLGEWGNRVVGSPHGLLEKPLGLGSVGRCRGRTLYVPIINLWL